MPKNRYALTGRLVLLLLIFLPSSLYGAKRQEETIPEIDLNWGEPTQFSIDDMPIIDFLRLYAKLNRFSFLLDRRIDPNLSVHYSAQDIPLALGLTELLRSVRLEPVFFGSFVYIGPEGAAGRLLLDRALRQERLAANSVWGNKLTKNCSLTMEEGAIPSETLARLAKEMGGNWENLDKMPFDSWREVHFPSMSTGDIISFLLIGFNVSWRADDKKPVLRPVPFDSNEKVTRSYSEEALKGIARDSFPEIQWTETLGMIRASGTYDTMAAFEFQVGLSRMRAELDAYRKAEDAALAKGGSRSSTGSSGGGRGKDSSGEIRLLTGEVRQASLRAIFENFQIQLGMEAILDPSAEARGVSLDQRISCTFRGADRRKAAKIVADTLGVSFRIEGDLCIFYSKKGSKDR